MLKNRLENEPKTTLVCVVVSALSLVCSLTGVLKDALSADIAWIAINLTAVLLSALGVLTPVTGALWHNVGSVFVVLNAIALLRVKPE